MKKSVWRLFSLVLLFACVAWTQDYRGRVQGIITDPANAAVSQATVTLLNTNTRTLRARVRFAEFDGIIRSSPRVLQLALRVNFQLRLVAAGIEKHQQTLGAVRRDQVTLAIAEALFDISTRGQIV